MIPIAIATAVTLALYYQQALLLLLKVGQVFSGVFDTSVPAFPLAGMLFVLMFIGLKKHEFWERLAAREADSFISIAAAAMAVTPLVAAILIGPATDSYAFAGIALVTCWVGIVIAIRPSLFSFLFPYLGLYLAAVGTVGVLTTSFGDPLAIVVAAVSEGITTMFHIPVQWSSVNISFVSAGGSPVNLFISQECSGIASMSIFLLLMGLMHLDMKPELWVSAAFAVGGSALFLVLNSLRVVILIVAGIDYGQALLWNLHGWVGYAFYIVGYLALVVAYFRVKSDCGMPTRAGRMGGQRGPGLTGSS
ncbi:MAG: exosortase/archaeosortase family protein [Nitrososphaerota archaeon]|nr:exosortase/archaeosortase family protein [Nitrososphaerota archaeon]